MATVVALALTGCGSGTSVGSAVARVGSVEITSADLSHWVSLFAPEHYVPDPPAFKECAARQERLEPGSLKPVLVEECKQRYAALRRQALEYLIFSHWLVQEAEAEGLRTPDQEVSRRKDEGRPLPFQGGTSADRDFAARAELAALNIAMRLRAGEPAVTSAAVSAYYHRHIAHFTSHELRYVDFLEHIPTVAEARKLRAEVLSGKRKMASSAVHEVVYERHTVEPLPGQAALARAIFAAKAHVLSEVLPFDRQFSFFEITRIAPSVVTPLSRVRNAITAKLVNQQRAETDARFVAAWSARWIARTDCKPGYVVQRCRQFAGRRATEDPFEVRQ